MHHAKILFGILFAVVAPVVWSADLSLEQSLRLAQRFSAELSANHHQVNALNNMADSAMELPDPQLKFGIENLPLGGSNAHRLTREGMTMQRVGVMQDYISSTKREKKSAVIRAEAQQTAAGQAVIVASLQRETAQAWLALALSLQGYAAVNRLVTESSRQIAIRNSAGNTDASNLLDSRLTLSAMQDQQDNAARDVAMARYKLRQLTGQQVEGVSGELPRYQQLPASEQSLQQRIDSHPEIIQARRESETAQAKTAQSAVAAIPDIGVELYYARRADNYDDMAGVMVTVDLPIFTARRQDKAYAADVARAWQANDALTLQRRAHQAQLDTLLAQYQAAHSLWRRQAETIIPLQQSRVRILNAQYLAGKSDLAAVLDARRALLSSEIDKISAEKEMAMLWAAIRYLNPQDVS
ncbi:TolC family protein [Erwiniaceae bacterium BAC15a-03b]|uniref:TolC family protein n=1 Tax=Winslowiella arboricola TaxID=2978220 RepID=A0A9J6PW31_9GAMM|nr:TolC family protein [Winslowiella arboricola]MCU5775438.1 TolC family protein [Winslowiella arboricola]MCU5779712.1 TolC family protein [Winslowiella arboricola]